MVATKGHRPTYTLETAKKLEALACLIAGASLRETVRRTGIHRKTAKRLQESIEAGRLYDEIPECRGSALRVNGRQLAQRDLVFTLYLHELVEQKTEKPPRLDWANGPEDDATDLGCPVFPCPNCGAFCDPWKNGAPCDTRRAEESMSRGPRRGLASWLEGWARSPRASLRSGHWYTLMGGEERARVESWAAAPTSPARKRGVVHLDGATLTTVRRTVRPRHWGAKPRGRILPSLRPSDDTRARLGSIR